MIPIADSAALIRSATAKRALVATRPWEETHHRADLDAVLLAAAIAAPVADEIRHLAAACYAHGYLAKPEVVVGTHLAIATSRPLLAVGPPGCGKTRLYEVLHTVFNTDLAPCEIAFHSELTWEELFFRWNTHALDQHWRAWHARERAGAIVDWHDVEADAKGRRFMVVAPLVEAIDYGICGRGRRVLLGDELDKAPADVEQKLLKYLNDYTINHPDLGYLEAPPGGTPIVVLTANQNRPLDPATLRRCEVLVFDLPVITEEDEILSIAAPGLASTVRHELLLFTHELRANAALNKMISISEIIDAAHALALFGAGALTEPIAELLIPVLAKSAIDQHRAARKISGALEVTRATFASAPSSSEAILSVAENQLYARRMRRSRETFQHSA